MKLHVGNKIHYNSGPNMTPLVDVVMVILIFLMLAGNFGVEEHYLVSNVPIEAKGSGTPPPPGSPIPTKFTISVSYEGGYYIARAGKFASVKNVDPQRAANELTGQLASQMTAYKDAGIKPEDIQVVIYPTATVTLDAIVPIMQSAQQAGFQKIGFGINP